MGQQDGNVLLRLSGALLLCPGALQQKLGKHLRLLALIISAADDDAAGVQIVIECFGFAQEFRAEEDVVRTVLFADGFRVAHRDGGLDHHEHVGVHFQRPLDGVLHGGGVKEVIHVVIVRRRGDDDQLGAAVGLGLIGGGAQVQRPLPFPRLAEKALNLFVLNGAYKAIELFGLGLGGGNGGDFVVLCQQHGKAQSDVAHACNSDLHSGSSLSARCRVPQKRRGVDGMLCIGIDAVQPLTPPASKKRCISR